MNQRIGWNSLALGLWFLGCGSPSTDWPIRSDLAESLPAAYRFEESERIDLGTQQTRPLLLEGWWTEGWDRARQRGYVQPAADQVKLGLWIARARDLVLRVHGKPIRSLHDPGAEVELLVNGNPAGKAALSERFRRYRFRIPQHFVRPGMNELTLRHLPAHRGVGEAMAWYALELPGQESETLVKEGSPRDNQSLFIPYGASFQYVLELPAEARLELGRVQVRGEAGGRLTIQLEEDGRDAVEIAEVRRPAEHLGWSLSTTGARVVGLKLIANPPDSGSTSGGIVLTAPVIRAPSEGAQGTIAVGGRPDSRSRSRPTSVLLYVVDTLRSDHLGVYGYPLDVSPRLDRFAAEATMFENAIGQSSWTRAAMASLFTGLWPVKHSVNGRMDTLVPEAVTLAEVLQQAGWQTTAVVRNWNVFPVFGFAQGFDEFRDMGKGRAQRVNQAAAAFLDQRDPERPFFLYLHTVDPHEPYQPPARWRQKFDSGLEEPLDLDRHPSIKTTGALPSDRRDAVVDHLTALYDAEIAANDDAFGDLVELLRRHELIDETLIIFVSDHGEEFLDHGTWAHGRNLFAATLNIPLVIRFPDLGHGAIVEEPVQQIDLMPTILDYLGIETDIVMEGRSLVRLVEDVSSSRPQDSAVEPVFSYLHLDGLPQRSVVAGDWKLIQRLDGVRVIWTGLFNRREDPKETRNRIFDYPIRARHLELLLSARVAEGSRLESSEAVIDERTERALKALGYLQ